VYLNVHTYIYILGHLICTLSLMFTNVYNCFRAKKKLFNEFKNMQKEWRGQIMIKMTFCCKSVQFDQVITAWNWSTLQPQPYNGTNVLGIRSWQIIFIRFTSHEFCKLQLKWKKCEWWLKRPAMWARQHV